MRTCLFFLKQAHLTKKSNAMKHLPTLEEVLIAQERLDILCADRELATKEIFRANAFYGNNFILKTYAGIPKNYPLKFIIPHGISSETYVWSAEVNNSLPAVICFQKNRQTVYKSQFNNKRIIRCAAPYIYIPSMLGKSQLAERKGTIFFPSHSTHHMISDTDYQQLADTLVALDSSYHPVTVCIYWKDFNLGHHSFFEKRGLQIVSAGHIFDPMFLFRLYHLCSQYEFSACNRVGTHIFYAMYAGCKHFHINTGKWHSFTNHEEKKEELEKLKKNFECCNVNKELKETFISHPDSGKRYKKAILDDYLSIYSKKDKYELAKMMIECECLYRASKCTDAIKKYGSSLFQVGKP
ncbi:MAG: hypothetical protein D3924_13810 [Candidatus Electrothrix sp. AR4]|nr:hypothetical protein [Candidatus Electrothrix sp. AR4]